MTSETTRRRPTAACMHVRRTPLTASATLAACLLIYFTTTTSISCGFVVQLVVEQALYDKSTTDRKLTEVHDKL